MGSVVPTPFIATTQPALPLVSTWVNFSFPKHTHACTHLLHTFLTCIYTEEKEGKGKRRKDKGPGLGQATRRTGTRTGTGTGTAWQGQPVFCTPPCPTRDICLFAFIFPFAHALSHHTASCLSIYLHLSSPLSLLSSLSSLTLSSLL